MLSSLIQAQTNQIAMLQPHTASGTGNTGNITGQSGFLALKPDRNRIVRGFQELQLQYLTDNGLITRSATKERWPARDNNGNLVAIGASVVISSREDLLCGDTPNQVTLVPIS